MNIPILYTVMVSDQIQKAIASAYDSLAERYESLIVPLYRPLAKRMLQHIDLRPGWQVLDAGTGTGLVALLGAPRVGASGKMIGVDVSPGMLEIARRKAAQFGFRQCAFQQGDLQALEFGAGEFNAVLAQFSLHYTDPVKSLSELNRVLAPKGTLVLHLWASEPIEPMQKLYEVLESYRADDTTGRLAALREQAERSSKFRLEYGTREAIRGLVQARGFDQVDAKTEDHRARVANADAFLEIASSSMLLAAELEQLSETARKSFLEDAREGLRAFETANGFEWVYHVVAVVARK